MKAKDYATVVTKYGEYLKQNNYQDTARIFNCGYAANQAKNYAEAAKYFDMAVKMNYAEKMYKEVLAVSNKDYQSNAYYSLGAMLYGNGAKILQAATPIATSEPDKYNAEKAKADKDFKQAKEYLTKAVELDPKDENSKKILASINDILK